MKFIGKVYNFIYQNGRWNELLWMFIRQGGRPEHFVAVLW